MGAEGLNAAGTAALQLARLRAQIRPKVKDCSCFVLIYAASMLWTDEQLERLRIRMADGRQDGVWILGAEASLISLILQTIRRLTQAKGWSGVSAGMLPTIGDMKRQRISTFTIHCSTPNCGSTRRWSFEELGLDDRTVFVEIPRARRFICRRCRGRKVTVMADWPSALGPALGARGEAWAPHDER